ncbi:MAG: hypothetical protein AAF641_10775 [Pseudomonadota bacterium]
MPNVNPFAIGFAVVAAGAFVGADFWDQAGKSQTDPEAFSKHAYLDTVEQRGEDTVGWFKKKQAQSVNARDHLPDAPEGWTRDAWDVERIDLAAMTKGMNIVEKSRAKQEHIAARLVADDDVWEYRRESEVLRIFVRFDRERYEPKVPISGWLTERFAPMNKPVYSGYAVVQGVPFLKVESGRDNDLIQPLMLEAVLGDNVTLAIAGKATRQTVLELVERIDFDALNEMLDHSIRPVGSAAPKLDDNEAMTLARLHADARNRGVMLSLTDMNATLISQVDNWDAFLNERGLADATLSQSVAEGIATAVTENVGVNSAEPEKPTVRRLQLSGGGFCAVGSSAGC